jgi:hypothetical protein
MAEPENTVKQGSSRGGKTKWQKGQSGNPGGRPREVADIKELCRKFSRKAVDALVECLESSQERTRVAAAEALLDRGYGRPVQGLEVSQLPPIINVRFVNDNDHDKPASPAPPSA